MPARGEVYFPDATLPPKQNIPHRCVILSPTTLMSRHPNTKNNLLFVMVAIIRSAKKPDGSMLRPVMGHSIPVGPSDLSVLQHDSYVETHQLFAVAMDVFLNKRPAGRIPDSKMIDILAGARRLFT